ncbi:capsule biosynthesis GfcC family protein [Photobacterium alginatilyticum]|uniref:Polysaccharide synthesis n=1 Tax=Photobacterium alginatilyticum TaxID=1775171 RepID=A0ABW9YD63_9GAMM|nr:capsule biosynthesis GfcC family protein [Photobacterium alginatilyticum]NBI51602.1 polysaccharide synthesis [Photobacterium alginatilyticum]
MTLLVFRNLAGLAISATSPIAQRKRDQKRYKPNFLKIFLPISFVVASLIASSNLMAQAPSHEDAVASRENQPVKITVKTSLDSKHQLELNYPVPVRVNQILSDSVVNINQLPLSQEQTKLVSSNDIFWTGAALFERFPHPQKQRVVNQLKQLASVGKREWEEEQSQAAFKLAAYIENLKVGQRIFTPLDYDIVRIEPAKNPLVNNDMTLVLPSRPSTVLITGAVTEPKVVSWQERGNANSYLKHAVTLNNSANSEVWVIQPDGQVEQHPIAYWNQKHFEIAPGATIYLGFSSLPDEFNTINEDIVNLLRNRAP